MSTRRPHGRIPPGLLLVQPSMPPQSGRRRRLHQRSMGGAVLLVTDMLAPGDGAALVIDLLHRYVGHEAVGGGAVPVVLARLEEHAVARADHLDLCAAALAEAYTLGDVDGLAVRVGVPSGSSARGEVDAGGRKAGWL